MTRSRLTVGLTGFRPVVFGLLTAGLVMLAAAFAPATGRAMTTLSQGYTTTDKVALGSIVSLQDNSSDKVLAANSKNIDGILGIVITDGSSLLSLSDGSATQIQVSSSGVLPVLVSDINGSIKRGDYVTASPIDGVGMKATSSIKVIGIAQDDLSNRNSSKQSYTDKAKVKHDVTVGQIPVIINVSYYTKQPEKTLVPSGVQSIANALAGKSVSPLPVLISMGIFIITIIVVVSIIFSMIRSSIISVGRNPMSQSAIYRDVVQMSALVVGILAVATVAIYLILRKF